VVPARVGELPQFLGVGPGPGTQGDHGGDLLAEEIVANPDDGGLGDGGVLVEDLLDLPWVDVVAAADDEVLLAVDDVVVAVAVHPGQIAGVQPAVHDGLRGGVGRPQYPAITLCPHTQSSPAPSSGSRRRISTPSMGVPTEPGLRGRSRWLKETTGEVSDMP
jgi:hypothetical protein